MPNPVRTVHIEKLQGATYAFLIASSKATLGDPADLPEAKALAQAFGECCEDGMDPAAGREIIKTLGGAAAAPLQASFPDKDIAQASGLMPTKREVLKAHVQGHTRTLKNGKVVTVHAHDTKIQKKLKHYQVWGYPTKGHMASDFGTSALHNYPAPTTIDQEDVTALKGAAVHHLEEAVEAYTEAYLDGHLKNADNLAELKARLEEWKSAKSTPAKKVGHYAQTDGGPVWTEGAAKSDTKHASLAERTVVGENKNKGWFIRAADAADAKAIAEAYYKVVGDTAPDFVPSGGNHFGKQSAFPHLFLGKGADAHAMATEIHAKLNKVTTPAPTIKESLTVAPAPPVAPPVQQPEPPAQPAAPEPVTPSAMPQKAWTPGAGTVVNAVHMKNVSGGHNKEYILEVHKRPDGKFTLLAAWGKIGQANVQAVKGTYPTQQAAVTALMAIRAEKVGKGYTSGGYPNVYAGWNSQNIATEAPLGPPTAPKPSTPNEIADASDKLNTVHLHADGHYHHAKVASGLAQALSLHIGHPGATLAGNASEFAQQATDDAGNGKVSHGEAMSKHAKAALHHLQLAGTDMGKTDANGGQVAPDHLKPFHAKVAAAHKALVAYHREQHGHEPAAKAAKDAKPKPNYAEMDSTAVSVPMQTTTGHLYDLHQNAMMGDFGANPKATVAEYASRAKLTALILHHQPGNKHSAEGWAKLAKAAEAHLKSMV
jgi:predicted DNA-binding WGR domain protein